MDRNDLILQSYFNQIKQIPLLSFKAELELSRRIQKGDEAARRALIEANLRLVVKIAKAYLTSDMVLMDIIQEGNMGLIKAVDKYDHAKNVRFSTYAGWWIRQAVSRFISNKRRAIRLPHRKEETLRRIQRAYQVLSQIYMRQPKTEEIAVEIGVSLDDVEFILNMSNSFVTLPADRGDEDCSGFVDIHEDYTYNPERAFIRKSFRDATLGVLNHLKDRERRILIYRYQINGCERHTLKTIGDKMGLSPETVRQIEIKALQKIRNENEDLQFYYMEAM
jgi:RNA polymerase primary sigma factor